MANLKKLTKKTYLGKGYIHVFKKKEDGKEIVVPCTQEDYDALSLPNAPQPVLTGYEWSHSAGGTIKVDTPTTILSDGEYAEVEGECITNIQEDGKIKIVKFQESELENGSLDLDKVIKH